MRGCSGWAATTEAAKATAEAKASDLAYMIADVADNRQLLRSNVLGQVVFTWSRSADPNMSDEFR